MPSALSELTSMLNKMQSGRERPAFVSATPPLRRVLQQAQTLSAEKGDTLVAADQVWVHAFPCVCARACAAIFHD